MSQTDLAAIAETLPGMNLTLIGATSNELELLPANWRPIAALSDPQARLDAALALWNEPFLAAAPQFAHALRNRFFDVRPCRDGDDPALLYLATHTYGHLLTWIGYDPATFVEPHFWQHFPPPLQVFLREVHAGFTSGGRDAFGLMHPRHMQAIAEQAGEPDGLPDWDDEQDIASTRLLLITNNGSILDYCISPDLDPDELALVYEGDIDPQPYGKALDDLLLDRLER